MGLFDRIGYRPNAGQRRFHESPAAFKCGLAGVGGGKTKALCVEALRLALTNAGCTGMIVAPTWDMLIAVTLPTFRSLIPEPAETECGFVTRPRGARRIVLCGDDPSRRGTTVDWSRTEMCATIRNASASCRVFFRSAAIADHLRGTNLAWFAMDEAARCDRAAWEVLLGRVRVRCGRRPGGIAVSTPNGYDWLHDEFAGQKAAALGRGLIRWRTDDNAENLRPGYAAELRAAYSPAFARQEIDGEFVAMSGAVFGDFLRAPYPAGNLVPWAYRPDRPTWLGLDFGFRRPAAVWVQEVSSFEFRVPSSEFRVSGSECHVPSSQPETRNSKLETTRCYVIVDEFVPEDCPIDRFVAAVKARSGRLDGIFGDPAGAGVQSTGDSDIRRFADAGLTVRVCRDPVRTRVLYGIQRLQSLVRAQDGSRRLLLATDEAGRCRAPAVLAAMERYRWPIRSGGIRDGDEPVKDGVHDHPIDALRYWAIQVADRPAAAVGALGGSRRHS